MTARFVLSFDCEGKWGVADLLDRQVHETLSDSRLREAYSGLVALLAKYQMPATFAFVGAFGERQSGLRRIEPELVRMAKLAPDFLEPALGDLRYGSKQGWTGDWAVDTVGGSPVPHEIALHGVTHIPWSRMTDELLDLEVSLFGQLESPVRRSRTFVYPRNDVAHVRKLQDLGMVGYRLARARRFRGISLLSEFNVFASPDTDSSEPCNGLPRAIPAGRFLNWQRGLRRAVPQTISSIRTGHMMAAAERSSGIVHFWLHPENLASAPQTFKVLEDVLRQVAAMREAGRCRVLTQLDYCLTASCGADPSEH